MPESKVAIQPVFPQPAQPLRTKALELQDFKPKIRYTPREDIITLNIRSGEHVGDVITRMIETVYSPIKEFTNFEVQVNGKEVKLRQADRDETPMETVDRLRKEYPGLSDTNFIGFFYTAFAEFCKGEAPTPGLRYLETFAELCLDVIPRHVSDEVIAQVSDSSPMADLFTGQRIIHEELDSITISNLFPLGHSVTLLDVIEMANRHGYVSADDYSKLVFPSGTTSTTAGNYASLDSTRKFESWEEVIASRNLTPGEMYYYIKTIAKALLAEVAFARSGHVDRSAKSLRDLTGKLCGAVRCFFDDDYPVPIC